MEFSIDGFLRSGATALVALALFVRWSAGGAIFVVEDDFSGFGVGSKVEWRRRWLDSGGATECSARYVVDEWCELVAKVLG